jgi:membrane protein involved in colicin uptake
MENLLIGILLLGVVCISIIVNKKKAAEKERIRLAKGKAAEEERSRLAKEKAAEEERIRLTKEKAAEEERIRLAKDKAAEKKRRRLAKARKEKNIKVRISNQLCPDCHGLTVNVFTDGSGECTICHYTSANHKNPNLPSGRVHLFNEDHERGWW